MSNFRDCRHIFCETRDEWLQDPNTIWCGRVTGIGAFLSIVEVLTQRMLYKLVTLAMQLSTIDNRKNLVTLHNFELLRKISLHLGGVMPKVYLIKTFGFYALHDRFWYVLY